MTSQQVVPTLHLPGTVNLLLPAGTLSVPTQRNPLLPCNEPVPLPLLAAMITLVSFSALYVQSCNAPGTLTWKYAIGEQNVRQ